MAFRVSEGNCVPTGVRGSGGEDAAPWLCGVDSRPTAEFPRRWGSFPDDTVQAEPRSPAQKTKRPATYSRAGGMVAGIKGEARKGGESATKRGCNWAGLGERAHKEHFRVNPDIVKVSTIAVRMNDASAALGAVGR